MMSSETLLLVIIVLPFLGSLLAAFLPRAARNAAAALAGTTALAGLAATASLYASVSTGTVIRSEIEWLPSLGLNLLIRLDGLSWIFAVLVLGIGALVVLYARYYMSPADPVPRFFAFLLAFMGSMLGLVLSGNLVQLVFFWELTSLFSFLLIGYWHHNRAARDAARMALIVTAAGGLCLLVGIVPAATIGPFLATAVRSVLGEATPAYSLAVWHGFTPVLFMSLTALVLGSIGYLLFRDDLNRREGAPLIRRLKGRRIFEASLSILASAARRLERLFGTRRLQPQLRLLVLVALIAGLLPFLRHGYSLGDLEGTIVDPGFAVIWMIGGACAIGAAWQAKYHRLAALILTGGAGLVSCISFLWLSAPDLALTQLLVETVTTVLLLLGLRWLPKRIEEVWPEGRMPLSVRTRRGTDLALAIAAGLGMTLIAYAVMTRPLPDTISRFFIERAYPDGGGTNVVNVILVDFRAFDTLGEITVLAIVALTVFSLLRRFRPARESLGAPVQQRQQDALDEAHEHRNVGDTLAEYLLIPRVIMEWLFPVILVFAIYLWIRGHDMPGGGFAAGITLSIALIVQYMAAGTRRVELRLRVQPARWIGYGLLLALLTGVGAWLFDRPFLTSYFRYLDLPVFGSIPVASALLFDLGVFLLVVGATALILIAIAHQSIRRPFVPGDRTPPPGTGEG